MSEVNPSVDDDLADAWQKWAQLFATAESSMKSIVEQNESGVRDIWEAVNRKVMQQEKYLSKLEELDPPDVEMEDDSRVDYLTDTINAQ